MQEYAMQVFLYPLQPTFTCLNSSRSLGLFDFSIFIHRNKKTFNQLQFFSLASTIGLSLVFFYYYIILPFYCHVSNFDGDPLKEGKIFY